MSSSSRGGVVEARSYFNQLSEYTATYNYNLDSIPGLLRFLVRSQRVEILLEAEEGSAEVIGAVTDSYSAIVDYLPRGPDNPTLRIQVRPGTVERLRAENSGKALLEVIGDDIRISGVGPINGFRALLFRAGARVAGMFP